MKSLLLTGVPGWLTTALLDDYVKKSEPGLEGVAALVHPSMLGKAREIQARHPAIRAVNAHDLESMTVDPRVFEGMDSVFHTAAVIHVKKTNDWYRINRDGTLALGRAAKEAGVKRFVFVSTNGAGGKSNGPDHLLQESDEPKPLSHYGRSKLEAERGLMAMHEPGRFEVVVLRPSMFYGPPVPERHINIYKRIMHGRMPMFGDGHYTRSIVHIDNLVQVSRLALTRPEASGQTYYVVDKPVYTTLRICEAMAAGLGVKLRTLPIPAFLSTVAFMGDRVLASAGVYWMELHLSGEANWHVGISCAKAERELGYRPTMELEQGMRDAVEWCRREGKL